MEWGRKRKSAQVSGGLIFFFAITVGKRLERVDLVIFG